MAWESSRPVPWRRLMTEWAIYAAVMVAVFGVFVRGSTSLGGLLIGLAVSLPIWLGLSYVLAKFGYQRKTLKEARAARATSTASVSSTAGTPTAAAPKARPAPTKRTSGGSNNSRPKGR